MSLYGKYIEERLGDGIVEWDHGFATYRFVNHDGLSSIYIVDIYVEPNHRKTKLASEMADKIVAIGKEAGCLQLIGTVSATAKGATDSLRVLLGYGMTLLSADGGVIIFKKGI